MEHIESRAEGWAKVMLPVLIPLLIGGCVFLGKVAWNQSSQISELKTHIDTRTTVINEHETSFKVITRDITQINLELSTLHTRLTVSEQTQGKVATILDELNKTLERINVTVGKLETRLDYAEKRGS